MTTTEDKTKLVTDLFAQALSNYEKTVRTGLKMQEEATKCLAGLATENPATAPQEWQKRMKVIADEFVPQSQKNVEEGLKLIEQSGRTSVELLKKAIGSGYPSSFQDAQAKFLGLWEGSLNAIRETTVAVAQTQNRAVESWLAFARKSAEPTPAAAGTKP